MSDPHQPNAPAGWHPDGQGGQRWWDGERWTEAVQPSATPESPLSGQSPSGPPPSGPPPSGPPPGAPPSQAPYAGSSGSGSGSDAGKGKIIGAAAAVAVLVVVGVVLLFTVVLGGSGPDDAAEDFLRAQSGGDQERVCELTSSQSREGAFELYEVDDCSGFAEAVEEQEGYDDFAALIDDVEVDTEIGTVKEEGESATVSYSQDVTYTGDDEEKFSELFSQDGTEFTEKGSLALVKEDGEWKVDQDESSSE